MGEVIEINIVSKDKSLLLMFLDFISLQMKNDTNKKTIEVMDNWQYENVETLDTIDLIKEFIGNKIVCVTEKKASGQAGVHIEPIDDLLLYNIWFNLPLPSSDAEYHRLIDEFMRYIFNRDAIKNIIIGAIGKETKFEYLGDSKTTMCKAHNVDVWLIDKKDILNSILEKYKVLADIYSGNIHKEMLVLSKL